MKHRYAKALGKRLDRASRSVGQATSSVSSDRLDRDSLARLVAQYDELAAQLPLGDTFDLRSSVLIGLKYQRVQLAPGLFGTVSSDDGRVVTLHLASVKAWLAVHSH